MWAGDRESPQLQLSCLGGRDVTLEPETRQIPLVSPIWAPQNKDILLKGGFVENPNSQHTASVGCSLRGPRPSSSSAELFVPLPAFGEQDPLSGQVWSCLLNQ